MSEEKQTLSNEMDKIDRLLKLVKADCSSKQIELTKNAFLLRSLPRRQKFLKEEIRELSRESERLSKKYNETWEKLTKVER